MTQLTTADRVRKTIVSQLGVEASRITDEASILEDLGADSLDTVELMFAIEEEFDIHIEEEDIVRLTTVGEVIDAVETRIGS